MHIEVCPEDNRRRVRPIDVRCGERQPLAAVPDAETPLATLDCPAGECQDCREPQLGCRCVPGEG